MLYPIELWAQRIFEIFLSVEYNVPDRHQASQIVYCCEWMCRETAVYCKKKTVDLQEEQEGESRSISYASSHIAIRLLIKLALVHLRFIMNARDRNVCDIKLMCCNDELHRFFCFFEEILHDKYAHK